MYNKTTLIRKKLVKNFIAEEKNRQKMSRDGFPRHLHNIIKIKNKAILLKID